jgi:type IV pilus assembly protein PilA
MKKFFKQGNKGFTLIELLVVIAILGTLAAVVVLNVTKFIGEGETQANDTDLANVQTAVAAYMYDSSGHVAPTSLTDLTPYMINTPKCAYTFSGSKAIRGICN